MNLKHLWAATSKTSLALLVAIGCLSPPALAVSYIPISQNEYDQNGNKLIIQKFVESPELDPNELIREPFEFQGYTYELKSITKDIDSNIKTQEFTKEVSIDLASSNETKALYEVLPLLESTIEHEEDGYAGTLALEPDSISLSPTSISSGSTTKSVTKTYSSQFNDDSIIPSTISQDGATWTLASKSWSGGGNLTDASLPSSYTATAVYTRSVGYSKVNGYTATMTYRGLLEAEEASEITYEITYVGTEIEEAPPIPELPEPEKPSFVQNTGDMMADFFKSLDLFGTNTDQSANRSVGDKIESIVLRIGGLILSCVLGLVIFIGLWKFGKFVAKKKPIKSKKVIITARDEFSGVEKKIQKVKLKEKNPVVTINYAKAPLSKHFTITLKPELADKINGRRVTINIGKEVKTHLVGKSHGNDYIIRIERSD